MAADGYGPSQPASFDREGYGAALEGIDPIAGRQYLQALQKDTSPLTVSEGQTLLDRTTLKPLFTNVKPKEIDPNKPFMVIDGKVIPNPDYQSYELKKAAQGATRLNVHTNMGTQETEQSKAYGKNLGEVRSEIQKSGFVAPSVLTKLGRMEELLQNVDGGKLAPLGRDVASMAKSFGVNIDPNLGNKEAAQSLAVEMALSMKQPGSGPTTDKDFDNFMSTVPDLSKTAAGRSQIISTMRAKANRDLTIAKTARDYAAKNKGVIDDGFLDIAAQIVADNPVIQVQKPAATSGVWSITPVGR